MNIAKRILDYYEHKDFIDDYAMYLLEDTENCIYQIKRIFKNYPEFNDFNSIRLTNEDAERIYQYVLDNIETFQDTFTSYYVGHLCIDSISFGEQCEQLTGLYNHQTGKDYTLPYLKKIFDAEGFYISGNYAYYDLSGSGVMIKLIPDEIPFFEEILNKYN